MRNFTLPLLIFLLGISSSLFGQKIWQPLGKKAFSKDAAVHQSIAQSPGDSLYVAYQDLGSGDATTVRKYNGDEWKVIGSRGLLTSYRPHRIPSRCLFLSAKN